MKVEMPKKNQTKIIVTFVVVAILVMILILAGEKLNVTDKISDNEKFYSEYANVPIENVFKYVTASEAIELFKSEQAIIFMGFKDCKWCQSYAPILNEVAKNNSVDTIYYLNIKEDRKNDTEEYKILVEILKEYLYNDDNGNKRIYVPDVYFVKDGNVVGHNNDTSIISGGDTEEYYTETTKLELKNKLTSLIKKVYPVDSCDDSKKGC